MWSVSLWFVAGRGLMWTYDGAANEVPHEVDFVLGTGWSHEGLLIVGRHGIVVTKLIDEGPEDGGAVFERLRPGGWDLLVDETLSPVLTCGGVWVHVDRYVVNG